MRPCLVAAILFSVVVSPGAQDVPAPHAIGIEEGALILLERGDYIPRPLDDRTPVILRLGPVEPTERGFAYRLYVIGFEPGPHRLADYLMRPDGSPATELGDRTFLVRTVLPKDHDGSLTPHVPSSVPWFGGYRRLLAALALVWILGWVGIHRMGRNRRKAVTVVVEPPPPGFGEKMQPYLERAARDSLDADGQAELERLLIAYWRDRLSLPEDRMSEAFAALRSHPEASATIGALERWLHRPGGAEASEIEALLEPYRKLDAAKEVVA